MRATFAACDLNSRDFPAISSDIKTAISLPGQRLYGPTDYYPLLGKIEIATGQYDKARDSLEKAMLRDLSSADKIFSIDGVEPTKTSKFCAWNLADLDTLISKFPRDYRPLLFHGLYYKFFTTFKETYYAKALQDFQKAALLNPASPLPQYFIADLYTKAAFWTKKAWASDAGRDEPTRNSIQAYTKAIQIDPKFLPAYEGRASGYLNLKQYRQSIRDFDKVLELNEDTTAAYSDRGIDKLELGEYFAAISDFQEAIRRKDPGDIFVSTLYEDTGDAHVKLGLFPDAIADYTKAIERYVANDIFLLSLHQIRLLYPEYDLVSDEVLCRKLNVLFYPQMEYEVFAKQLMEKNGKWSVSMLNELYEKRGDAYLQAGDYRRGVMDLNRIFKGIPNFADATDRWRLLGIHTDGGDMYLDTQTADFSTNPIRFWVKTVGKKETETSAYDLDCTSKRINETGTIAHDSAGKVVRSSDESSGWQRIIPDTIGERLYNGACTKLL